MLLAFRQAGPAVAAFGARCWVAAAVPVSGPLELPADLDHACVEVDVLPSAAERLALADAEREGDRPAGAFGLSFTAARIWRASSRVSGSISISSPTRAGRAGACRDGDDPAAHLRLIAAVQRALRDCARRDRRQPGV